MRADADPDAGGFDGGDVGAGEILLAEMHEAGAEFDRLAPIVVDDERQPWADANSRARAISVLIRKRRHILDAKLDELRALARDAGDPGGVGKDGIERIESRRRSRDAIDLEERRAGDRGRGRRHVARLDQPCLEAEAPGLDRAGERLRHLHRIGGLWLPPC